MLFRVLKFVAGKRSGRAARLPREVGAGAPQPSRIRPRPVRPAEPRHGVLLGGHAGRRAADPDAATRAAPCATRRARPARSAVALDRGYVVASGRGTVFSYVVHRHPPVPGARAADPARPRRPRGGRPDGRRARRTRRRRRSRSGMPVVADFQRDRRRPHPAGLEAGMTTSTWATAPRVAAAGHDHARRQHRDRHPRLPGRAPRPRPGAVLRVAGHLPQHPHHHRAGRSATSPTGPGSTVQVAGDRDPARRAGATPATSWSSPAPVAEVRRRRSWWSTWSANVEHRATT